MNQAEEQEQRIWQSEKEGRALVQEIEDARSHAAQVAVVCVCVRACKGIHVYTGIWNMCPSCADLVMLLVCMLRCVYTYIHTYTHTHTYIYRVYVCMRARVYMYLVGYARCVP